MLLDMAADAAPDRVAFGGRADGLTFATLKDRAAAAAEIVRRRGAAHVVLVGTNSAAVPTLLFGAAAAGVPFVPLNYRLDDERLAAIVARVPDAFLVADDAMVERLAALGIDSTPVSALHTEIEAVDTVTEPGEIDGDDIAVLLFTSGTTGEPKAAVLRHRHLTSYILESVEFLGADDDEAQLVSVPPYHVAGVSAVLSSVFAGRRVFYLDAFDAEDWVSAIETECITQAMVVPTMLGRILEVMTETGATLSSLRHLSYGGGRMPVPVIERALGMLPQVGWTNAYGLTETSSTIAVLGPEDHRAAVASDDAATRARLGSVGRPLPSLELEIRDDAGAACPVGVSGEIHVRGGQVAGEYLGRSALTADGWFPTNDAGHLDEGGYLFLDGRLDDVIVRGGENLSPGEIEDVVLQHPAVHEVGVVGVPDEEWGEAVAAAVVVLPGEHLTALELQSWVKSRLRSTKSPQHVAFVEELPYNETGKLLRRVLQSEFATLLGENTPRLVDQEA